MPPGTLASLNIPFEIDRGQRLRWGQLYGSSLALVVSLVTRQRTGPVLIITQDTAHAARLDEAIRFYLQDSDVPILNFPDWETLPYDVFSPHQDIISERLSTLYELQTLDKGILIVPVQTLMQRIVPRSYINSHCLSVNVGDEIDRDAFQLRLVSAGYQHVSSVQEHGEYSVRGSLIDLFPMGSNQPFRIEFFDNDIESIRTFNTDDQRSIDKIERIRLLPAREFPLDKDGIKHFRQAYRAEFEGDPKQASVYRDVSQGLAPAGIEYYLPFFFDQTDALFDYLPENALIITDVETEHASEAFWQEIQQRYEQGRHDLQRPLLQPDRLYYQVNEVYGAFAHFPLIQWQRYELETKASHNFNTLAPPNLILNARNENPAQELSDFLSNYDGRVLFTAETTGRRETLLGLLHEYKIHPKQYTSWQAFVDDDAPLGITVSGLEQGLLLNDPAIAIICESQLFGRQVLQRRRRQRSQRDAESVIRNLAELTIGFPVVHEEHGVGRYLGLKTLTIGDTTGEFLLLEYADEDKLYVPVGSLQLISRYTGASPENAPLHKLGSGQWERIKRKASEKVRDVAAELLEIYAKRQARGGYAYHYDEAQFRAFCATFPFEETPDQQTAIENVVGDLVKPQSMDHLVCGDVGFGKTEVAMRAAFIAVLSGKQVAVLTPTTLLTQQHLQTFRDRFSEWPVQIEALSRFRSKKEQTTTLNNLKSGKTDIIIGTHKLLQDDVEYKELGLVIIDEEHRFGVRQKDKFKALRADVDVLTLTATPIPRTLNMAMSGMRDISIIATPPAKRLAIKTFVNQWNDQLIVEAIQRELKRGGQVYFLHNDVETIKNQVEKLERLVPEATIEFAHGQMRERELEQVMADFYHQRFNVLVCTTIIETGIDIPNANTIIINRADRFGLAQLYQLRGRVGRSHHRAYCYLIAPPTNVITADATKRLEAIESIETLGTGFMLATHDLEIRGAGELLGEEQSGQIHEIGYSLYTELLERAVKALKQGKDLKALDDETIVADINLHAPALIPEDYLPDVHERLMLYKRIANTQNEQELKEIQVEMIDRFGLLPEPTKNLIHQTEIKQLATPMGVKKIDFGPRGGRIVFCKEPDIDAGQIIQLVQEQPTHYKFEGTDKLRLTKPYPTFEQRIQELKQLLGRLSIKKAA